MVSKKERKQRVAFFGGISFLALGFWMIFIAKDNLGFIPGIIGTLLIFWRFR